MQMPEFEESASNGVNIIMMNHNHDPADVKELRRVRVDAHGNDEKVDELIDEGFTLIRLQTESKHEGYIETAAYLVKLKEEGA